MAKFGEGVNYAKTLDPSSSNIIDPGLIRGKVRVMQDYITIASATVATQMSGGARYIIVGGKLPTGSQVVAVVLGGTGAATAGNSGSAIIVGDEGDDNRYIADNSADYTCIVTANAVVLGPNTAGGMYYTVTGTTDNYIRLSLSTAGGCYSAGTLKVSVMYTVE